MNDILKQFIQQHRNAFDAANPDAHAWKRVEKTLERWQHADRLEQVLGSNRVLLDTETVPEGVWNAIALALDETRGLDPLESFILKNRTDLDTALPPEHVWDNLAGPLPVQQIQKAKIVAMGWQNRLLKAAASVAILVAGVGIGMWYSTHTATLSGMAMSDVSSEYAELEQYYQREIANKQVKLASFQGSQPEAVHDDLDQMDQIMTDLRKELADVPPANREQIVRAMIENYKAKSAILQKVLERLEASKTETNNSGKKHAIDNI
ncbi:MAG: hypothetical protein NW218_08890 [Saprospiraceae bacterium]|nr:hypothetical protein [Saprospiraceae bacterium]